MCLLHGVASGASELRDVQFVNLLNTEVLLFWVLPQNQGLRFMQAIPASSTHPQRTVESHRFQGISVETGELVGIYDILPETRYVEMRGRKPHVITVRNSLAKDLVVYRFIPGWGLKRETRITPGTSAFVDSDFGDRICVVDALSDEMVLDASAEDLSRLEGEVVVDESTRNLKCKDAKCEPSSTLEQYEDEGVLGATFEDFTTTVSVVVFRNGGNNTGTEPVVHMRLPKLRSGMGLALLKRHAGPMLQFSTGVKVYEKDLSVYTRFGVEITDTADLQEGEMLFLVPKSHYFIWPGVRVGYQVVIPKLYNQDGQAIVLETVSLMPRVFSLSGFLTSKEITALKKLVDPSRAQNSNVPAQDAEANGDKRSLAQWVHGTPDIQEKIIKRIKRVSKVRSRKLYEPFQISKYKGSGESYHWAHTDYYSENSERTHVSEGKNRLLTMLFYLNTVKEGGHTVFPRAVLSETVTKTYGLGPHFEKSDCSSGLRIRPEKGKAILFYNLRAEEHMDGVPDERSVHTSCPVNTGQQKNTVKAYVKNRYYL